MRTVALEEHFTVPDLVRRIDRAAITRRGFRPRRLAENLMLAPLPNEPIGVPPINPPEIPVTPPIPQPRA